MSRQVESPQSRSPKAPARRILHLDMDAFYASIEVRDNPELRGLPVIVGGTPQGRGVVATASYEARKFGVHSAMPAARAIELCPRGVFLRPRMRRYVEVSQEIFAILREYSPLVEPLSIDEAFVDVTGCRALASTRAPKDAADVGSAVDIARELQARVEHETGGLSCSIGIARNKFLAKLASDMRKPNGLVVVPDDDLESFLAPLPIRRIWGVGPKMEEHLRQFGITTVRDVQRVASKDLRAMIGDEIGEHLFALVRGLDERPVVTDRRVKSISQERTYGEFIPPSDRSVIERELFSMSDQVATRLRHAGLWGRTVQLKVRDESFETRTRSCGLESPSCLVEEVFETVRRLFEEKIHLGRCKVRLLGVGVSRLTSTPKRQLDLLAPRDWEKAEELAAVADLVNRKLGEGAVVRGRLVPGNETALPPSGERQLFDPRT